MSSKHLPHTAGNKKNNGLRYGLMITSFVLISGCSSTSVGGDDHTDSPLSPSYSSSIAASEPETPAPTSDEPETVVIADYVGMGLQDAQDAAQADGVLLLDSTDASGLGRLQLWDRNWEVCAQSPAAGATLQTTDVLTFDVVDISEGETCS